VSHKGYVHYSCICSGDGASTGDGPHGFGEGRDTIFSLEFAEIKRKDELNPPVAGPFDPDGLGHTHIVRFTAIRLGYRRERRGGEQRAEYRLFIYRLDGPFLGTELLLHIGSELIQAAAPSSEPS